MELQNTRGWHVVVALALLAFALWVAWHATSYTLGSFARMGPGFYPLALGLILIVVAILNLVETARVSVDALDIRLRPAILISLALLAFGLALEPFGLVPATFALVIITSFADPANRPVGVVLTATGLSVLGVLVFIEALRLPLTAIKW